MKTHCSFTVNNMKKPGIMDQCIHITILVGNPMLKAIIRLFFWEVRYQMTPKLLGTKTKFKNHLSKELENTIMNKILIMFTNLYLNLGL